MPYARKKDVTHTIVVQALRAYGWTVMDCARAPLCIDLVIAKAGRVVLVEVKDRTGKLTDNQKLLLSSWPGETAVLRSLEDVARLTADQPVAYS
jgi:hypothetical protein